MKIEIKNIKHSPSLSEETNAFAADIFIDGEKVGFCSNRGHGGSTDYHPIYSEDKKKMEHYRNQIAKAETFCKKLPPVKSDFSDDDLDMNLEFYIELKVEDDLVQKNIKKVLKRLEKDCLNNVCLIPKKEFDDFMQGKISRPSYRMFGWKRPIAEIPVEHLKKQLPAIFAKMKNDDFVYNKNLPE